jgi:diguanylate cyclase (GGDEF)-like protein/PAS domain S-box-containing protein
MNLEAPVGDSNAPILVVDDSIGSRLAIRSMLAPLGHPIVEAGSGRDALRAVSDTTFALILMDVRMPTMDGYETAKLMRLRSETERTPIIFVSAFGRDDMQTAAAYSSGAVDFIFTPILPDVLRAKVSALVGLFLQAQALQRSVASVTTLNVALRDSEVRAHAVLQNVADGIVTAAEDGSIESFNRSARRLFGYDEDEVIGRSLELIVAPSHRGDFSESARARWELLTGDETPSDPVETMGCRKDGSCFPMEIGMSRMRVGDGTFIIGCLRDISGRKAYTEALEHRALHDAVTGLPNRALFADRIDRSIARAERSGERRGVLVLDLDGFREVNDIYGAEVGDAVLNAVADRIRATVRDADTVARLEGASFGFLPAGETDVGTAATAAWSLRAAFDHPFRIGEHDIAVQASVGIAFFPQHGRTTADLLRRAELAVNQAKASGRGLAVFVSEREDDSERRLALLSELRDGIPRGELVLHFQPKIELRPVLRIVGVEALVRWQHPTRGLLMPDQFVPEADRSALIKPLTRWVLDEALRQQSEWSQNGIDLTMAVNISAVSLTRGSDLPGTVARLTEAWGITPGRLILELTESALIGADAPEVLEVLHSMGERLAIDDFGTGHSSLVYLQQLPLDEIKVDRSFVMHLATTANDAVIARSTIDLAHNLDLTVVAEGVEDAETLERLLEYGCDLAQGYLFSRPLPAAELTTWLADSPYGFRATVDCGSVD